MPLGYLGLTKNLEAISYEKRESTEEILLGGIAGEGEVYYQTSPVDTATSDDIDFVAGYDVIGTNNVGLETAFCPASYDGSNWDTTRWVLGFQEIYCAKWPLTLNGSDYELQDNNNNNLGNFVPTYTQNIYDNGLTPSEIVPPASYTVDDLNGKITGYTPTGILRYEGYFLRQICDRFSSATNKEKHKLNHQSNLSYRVYSLLNPTFDLWDSSSVTKGWTSNGNVATTRIASLFQGSYAMRLSNSSSGTNYIDQQISVGDTVTQACLAVVMKVSAQAKIGVSLDGSNFNYASIDVASGETNAASKWITLYCTSPSGSSTSIYVRIYPQINTTDTGTVDIEAVMVADGDGDL